MADWLDNLRDLVSDTSTRAGYYLGTVTAALGSFRRPSVQPEWLEGESLERLTRIASPILDVVYKVGTRVAVISKDGVPELGAVLGAVTDDKQKQDSHTVWIRANLEQNPGHLNVGVTKGIDIRVGATNSGTLSEVGDGTVRIGSDLVDLVADLDNLTAQLSDLAVAIAATNALIVSAGGAPATPITAGLLAGFWSGGGAGITPAIAGISASVAAIKAKTATLVTT